MKDHREIFYKLYSNYFSDIPRSELRSINEMYKLEMDRAEVPNKAKILEIGFGYGHFLDYCKRKEYFVTGIEICKPFVDEALHNHENVFHGDYRRIEQIEESSFDIICLFDVLEHLYYDEIIDILKWCEKKLNPFGKIILRVPNCASPFGKILQNGDPTHVTELSAERISFITKCCGLSSKTFNSARPLKSGKYPFFLLKAVALFKTLVEIVLGKIYLGQKLLLDPNITSILSKDHKELS